MAVLALSMIWRSALSALPLLVGRQEGHLASKNWWDVGVAVWDEVQMG